MNIKPNQPPAASDLPANTTVGELAAALYPDIPFDTALPQPWVSECINRHGFDPRGQFVWGYPAGNCIGQPMPLTKEAARGLPARMI